MTYVNNHVVSQELPRIKVQPIIGHLDLVAVNYFLLEDTVSVSQPIAPRRVVERSQTVKEASGKSSKTSVAKGSVVLLLNNILDAETKVSQASWPTNC
jgi:hypothetical protein